MLQPLQADSKYRHGLRNTIHVLKLCLVMLDTVPDAAEHVEWLVAIEEAADAGIKNIDERQRAEGGTDDPISE